jgi:plasmid segregation protein ParM
MKTVVNAIDLGFMYTKAIVNGKPIIIKSVTGTGKELRFRGLNIVGSEGKDNIECIVDEQRYFVSDLALTQSKYPKYSLKGDRFDETATKVLLNAVLGLGYGSGNHAGYFVSGLPVEHFKNYEQDISKLFLGDSDWYSHDYNVTKDGIIHQGTVRALSGTFIPQPFGVAVDEILNSKGDIEDKGLLKSRVAVIDIGFGTTDVFVIQSFDTLESLTFSTRKAMNTAYTFIADSIKESGIEVSLPEVDDIVKSGQFRKDGKTYKIQPTIEQAFSLTAEAIVDHIYNSWGADASKIDVVILAGGGGLALQKWIKPLFSNLRMAKNGQMAVVNGYYKWGVMNYQDEA